MNIKHIIKKIIYKTYLFETIYQRKELIKSFPRQKLENNETNNIVGWVPYVKGKTNISVYNFLSTNYSIRDNIKFNIYLINKLEIINKLSLDLKPEEVKDIDLNKFFNDQNGQIIIGQLVSKRIKNNHAGNDGHFRFWGRYIFQEDLPSSIVHSMPLSSDDLFLRKLNHSRNYNYNENKNYLTKNIFTSGTQLIEGLDNSQRVYYGFNLITNKNNDPLAVWHLAPINNKKKNDKKEILQGAYCPDINGLDPYIILDPLETGIENNNARFYIVRNNSIEEKKEIKIEKFFKSKISDIFGKKIKPNYFIYIECISLGLSHSHIHYAIDEKICDQVHMHESNWQITNNKLSPTLMVKKRNCRKFFYFNFKNRDQQNLIIIHNEKIQNKEKKFIKVRLFSKYNFEKLNIIEINSENPIIVKNLSNLFDLEKIDFGVVQIESFDYNFHATGLSYNKNQKLIFTDHFTGG